MLKRLSTMPGTVVIILLWVGYLYEHSLGTMKFLAIGTFCAVLSLVIFLCIYRNAEGIIGGSVYYFALCGLGLTLQFLVPEFPKITLGTWSGNWLAIYLIASNVPFLSFMNITTVILHAIAFAIGMVVAVVCWVRDKR